MQRRLYQSGMVLSLLLLASCNFTPSTSRLAQIEQGFLDKKDDYVALYDMFMEDDKLTWVGDGFARVAINDYYKSDEYESDGEWYDKKNNKTTLPEILLDVGISQERYDLYLERMATVHVKRIAKNGYRVNYFKDSFGILDGWIIEIQ